MAAVPRRVRRREAAAAGPHLAGPAAGGRGSRGDDDRGARLLQRQGQTGPRLAAALPVVASGLQGSPDVTEVLKVTEVGILQTRQGTRTVPVAATIRSRSESAADGSRSSKWRMASCQASTAATVMSAGW